MVTCPDCGETVASFEEHSIPNNGDTKDDYSEIEAAVCPECEALWEVLEVTEA
ncbi:hypothetical protein SAMN05216226_1084 [Halovenus aranensis]|uniref:Uncharacterized protein n=1 Tax=Halovenus aranensis TaxID=890420 RepID=A0A1G8W0G6_9EURY|nr:hypothetical protein SAMN05216226_1084 [Halovenus aranensis]